MARKSLCVTYFLWLIGGLFGLHHLYLGRDRHAFLYWITLGGYFGLGWIRDLWNINRYVKDANEDTDYMQRLTAKMRAHDRPPLSLVRKMVQLFVADGLGYLTFAALPSKYISEEYWPFAAVVVPLAVAIGVHLVGNIGREEGNFIYPLCAAYLTYPLYFFNIHSVIWTTCVSIFAFETFALQWRRQSLPPKPFCHRVSILTLCTLLYLGLWASFFYFNCTVTTKEGEEIKCRDAAQHFFTSPIWKEFLSVVKEVFQFAQHHGWKEVWNHLVDSFDPQGVANAWKVFELNQGSTEQEIRAHYRKLSRQWHPDKHHDPDEKVLAQEKFIQIQEAYSVLSQVKSHRISQNVKNCEAESCE